MNKTKSIAILSLFATIFCLFVIGMGAYTRLKDAGLGCPDWPLCYGHLTVPHVGQLTKKIAQGGGFSASKAWAEMIHRYVAGSLGLMIIAIYILSWMSYRGWRSQVLPHVLLFLVFCQATLGMWTVTLKLLPLVVSLHLLGGMSILAVLCLLSLSRSQRQWLSSSSKLNRFQPWAWLGLVLLFFQIALGAWTSTNYAAISCSGFPFCEASSWFPAWNFSQAFHLFSPIGPDYLGGTLGESARQTIQMTHRFGAILLASYWALLILALMMFASSERIILRMGFLILTLLGFQFLMGILNVVMKHPLNLAVMHNLGAACLVLSVVSLNFMIWQSSRTK